MQRSVDIHKAAGVFLQDGKFLITRTHGKDYFIAPGGKLEAGETAKQALKRELQEELGVTVSENDLNEFGTYYALAAGSEDKYLQMDVFLVMKWDGEIVPTSEVEEVTWIDSNPPTNLNIGSIFQHDVLPKLKQQKLIA